MLDWNGEAIIVRAEVAAAAATKAVVDDAVVEAKEHTPVRTGEAQASLERENDGLAIAWGYHVNDEQGHDRGIWIEIGARGRPGVHALRRAADHHYPRLAGEIRRRFDGTP